MDNLNPALAPDSFEIQNLHDLIKKHTIEIEPEFTGKFIRSGSQYFKGHYLVRGEKAFFWAILGDWAESLHLKWHSAALTDLSQEDADGIKKILWAQKEELESEKKKAYEETAKEAAHLWLQAKEGRHPYLDAKKIDQGYGSRVLAIEGSPEHTMLLVPLRDAEGKLWNLQRIYGTSFTDEKTGKSRGNKFLLKGGRKEGLFHLLGSPVGGQAIYLCEGFATGCSVYAAMRGDGCVAVAFDVGNLKRVAEELISTYPNCRLILAGDNDAWKAKNAGKEIGLRLFSELGIKGIFPEFRLDHAEGKPTDWNDLAQLEGLERVREQLLKTTLDALMNPAQLPAQGEEDPRVLEECIVSRLLAEMNGSVLKWDRDLFEYDDESGIWSHLDPASAKNKYYVLINKKTNGALTNRRILETVSRLFFMLPSAYRNPLLPDPNCMGFSNGALHLIPQKEGKIELVLHGHAKENLLIHGYPFPYSHDQAENKLFEGTVERVLGNEAQAIRAYYQVLGACLMPGTFRKIVFFTASTPGSGKSTLIQFAWNLVDPRFRCTVDPTAMGGFGMEPMLGKILNADTDISIKKALHDSVLKKLEDGVPITIQRKGITNIQGRAPGMHLFGCNGMPRTTDGAGPYARRFLIFKCDYWKVGETFNKNYLNEVISEGMGGIIKKAMEGLQDLCSLGGNFTIPLRSREAYAEWEENNSSGAEQFLRELVSGGVEIKEPGVRLELQRKSRVSRKQLWEVFQQWWEQAFPRRTPPTRQEFFSELRAKGVQEIKVEGEMYFAGLFVAATPDAPF